MDLDKALYMREFIEIRETIGTNEYYPVKDILFTNLYDEFKSKNSRSFKKKKAGRLKNKNHIATKILMSFISLGILTSKKVRAQKRAIKPPTKPKPQAVPEILPTFLLFDKSIKYELEKTVPNS